MGASHLARGQGAVILSCVLSSMEHAFNKCLWVSGWGRGSVRAHYVVRNGGKRKHGRGERPPTRRGIGKQES